jgi:hypothetical protein
LNADLPKIILSFVKLQLFEEWRSRGAEEQRSRRDIIFIS